MDGKGGRKNMLQGSQCEEAGRRVVRATIEGDENRQEWLMMLKCMKGGSTVKHCPGPHQNQMVLRSGVRVTHPQDDKQASKDSKQEELERLHGVIIRSIGPPG